MTLSKSIFIDGERNQTNSRLSGHFKRLQVKLRGFYWYILQFAIK